MQSQTKPARSQPRQVLKPALVDALAVALGRQRPTVRSGHITVISVSHNSGMLKMDDGDTLDFAAAGGMEAGLKALHVGDHVWVATDQADQTPRELICPQRNRTLRVQLAHDQT